MNEKPAVAPASSSSPWKSTAVPQSCGSFGSVPASDCPAGGTETGIQSSGETRIVPPLFVGIEARDRPRISSAGVVVPSELPSVIVTSAPRIGRFSATSDGTPSVPEKPVP